MSGLSFVFFSKLFEFNFLHDSTSKDNILEEGIVSGSRSRKEKFLFGKVVSDARKFINQFVLSKIKIRKVG